MAAWVRKESGKADIVRWLEARPHQVGGLLGTAGHLVFSGAPAGGPGGFMVAYDPENGRQLWHVALHAPVSIPRSP